MSNPEDFKDLNDLKDIDDIELSLMSADFLKLIKDHTDQGLCLDAIKPWFVLDDGKDEGY
ncbi:MAG TPA: hypothetical protein VF682_07040 [Pseudomonas sp.]|jgi:hypothetical protein